MFALSIKGFFNIKGYLALLPFQKNLHFNLQLVDASSPLIIREVSLSFHFQNRTWKLITALSSNKLVRIRRSLFSWLNPFITLLIKREEQPASIYLSFILTSRSKFQLKILTQCESPIITFLLQCFYTEDVTFLLECLGTEDRLTSTKTGLLQRYN